MGIIERIRRRKFSDRADAIFVASVIFVPFMFLCSGFAMDVTKSVYVKQQYQAMGQDAAAAAVRSIDADGSIKPDAAQILVNTYRDRFNGVDSDAVNAGNSQNYSTLEATAGNRGSVCNTVDINGSEAGGVYNAPYMVITLNGGRSNVGGINSTAQAAKWVSEGYGAPQQDPATVYDPNVRYYAIYVTIYDSAPNLMLGIFGMPCQLVKSELSSVTFGSQEDLTDFSNTGEDGAACPNSNLRWTGDNTLAWDTMAGASNYKLVMNNADPNAAGTETSNTSVSGSTYNRLAAEQTWYLSARRGTGAWEACGSRPSEGVPVASCPTGITVDPPTGTNPYSYKFRWTPSGTFDDSIQVQARNRITGATGSTTVLESATNATVSVSAAANEEVEFLMTATRGSTTPQTCTPSPATNTPNVNTTPTCPTGFNVNFTPIATAGAGNVDMTYTWNPVSPNDTLTFKLQVFDSNYNQVSLQTYTVSESAGTITKTASVRPSDYVRGSITMVNGAGSTVSCGSRDSFPNKGTVAMPSCPSGRALQLLSVERTGDSTNGSIRYNYRITWTPRSGSANWVEERATRFSPQPTAGGGGGGGQAFEAKGSLDGTYALFFSRSQDRPQGGTMTIDLFAGDPSTSNFVACGSVSTSVPGY